MGVSCPRSTSSLDWLRRISVMQKNLTGLALVVSVVALALVGYGYTQVRSTPADLEARLLDLEEQMAQMEKTLAERAAARDRGPSLLGYESAARDAAIAAGAHADGERADGGGTDAGKQTAAPNEGDAALAEAATTPEALKALVDQAVSKKAAQLQGMQNKKPSMEVFAKTLELTDEQRQAAEQDVLRAQRDVRAILEMPTADGANLMDDLVEVLADSMAHPDKAQGRIMKYFGRLLSEKIPGSDETYAVRIEGVKGSLKETLRRNWSKEQYATFEAWQMDPTEVKEIEGSPWKEIEGRVIERARDLGAELPSAEDD